MTDTGQSGSCLCGAVKFTLAERASDVGVCHCGMCRKSNCGMPSAAVQGQVSFSEDRGLKWYASSPWGERGFCSECGASLFWRPSEVGASEPWTASTGALDDQGGLKIVEHIFIDDKPDFYDFTDSAKRTTGADFTAKVLLTMSEQYGPHFLEEAVGQIRKHSGDSFADAVSTAIEKSKA